MRSVAAALALAVALGGCAEAGTASPEEVVRSFLPEWSRETGNQLSLAFECSSPAEVDEAYVRVTGAGFEGEKEPWDAFWGQRYALLRDPDGVEVNLYAPLEGA